MPIKFNLSKYINPIYIESGTLYGGSAKKAVEAGFEKIYTIEIHPKYHKISKKNLKQYIEEGKVTLFLGDSKDILKELLPTIKEKMTIFLDAHWHRNRKDMDCSPLYTELNVLKLYPDFIDTIMVDDKRMMGKRSWAKNFNTNEIIKRLLKINKDFKISYEDGQVENDIIVATLKEE